MTVKRLICSCCPPRDWKVTFFDWKFIAKRLSFRYNNTFRLFDFTLIRVKG
jgi:hypothetical protein